MPNLGPLCSDEVVKLLSSGWAAYHILTMVKIQSLLANLSMEIEREKILLSSRLEVHRPSGFTCVFWKSMERIYVP